MRRFAAATCQGGVVAIDGETLRRSLDRASGASPLHPVSAWACERRLVLGRLAVDGRSNEITGPCRGSWRCSRSRASWSRRTPGTAPARHRRADP